MKIRYLCVSERQRVDFSVFVLCIQLLSAQVWCQALQSLTTYLMLTTYSWMLCEGAFLRFILVKHLNSECCV